jgi:uncharacterized protein (DUF302 family)
MNPEGMKFLASAHSVAHTINRMVETAQANGMTVFARIDHSAAAAAAGLMLSPMEVLIFGAPRAGTPLMRSSPTIGLDLPLRALAWEDGNGATWLAYNEPMWIASRHSLGNDSNSWLITMLNTLRAICERAVGKD